MKKKLFPLAAGVLSFAAFIAAPLAVNAADHADGPNAANDQGTDLADVFAFLDPADNTKTVLIFTWRGFITPGEAANLTVFDPGMRFRYAIENSGDANPDKHIDISFGPKFANDSNVIQPQSVFFQITGMKKPLEAPGTVPNLSGTAPTPVVTPLTLPTGETVELFAGLVDDPFFFDIPAFSRFVNAVKAGTANPELNLARGRDTFAGYNLLSVALRMPTSLLVKAGGGTTIGVAVLAQRHGTEFATAKGDRKGVGAFRTVDREGIPGVNAVLLPLNLRNAYNASHPSKDVKPNNPFATAILATLDSLGTNDDNKKILADIAVSHGDYLRLQTNPALIPNTGNGGGNNAGAGFPNGRRLGDDVIDTIIAVVSNGTITTGDSVNANDVPFLNTFPYLGLPQMPRIPAVIDDNTRN
ncbi:MAG: hypothetical protein JWL90_3696 [Chthoniobacteraceae bacterium]|nr:hypothetical protein [Chthoniobacteraceae bacterium]